MTLNRVKTTDETRVAEENTDLHFVHDCRNDDETSIWVGQWVVSAGDWHTMLRFVGMAVDDVVFTTDENT